MQAHALTPHMEDAFGRYGERVRTGGPIGQEPILTLLVSGKHVRDLSKTLRRGPACKRYRRYLLSTSRQVMTE